MIVFLNPLQKKDARPHWQAGIQDLQTVADALALVGYKLGSSKSLLLHAILSRRNSYLNILMFSASLNEK